MRRPGGILEKCITLSNLAIADGSFSLQSAALRTRQQLVASVFIPNSPGLWKS
jgi:hypothetical protein